MGEATATRAGVDQAPPTPARGDHGEHGDDLQSLLSGAVERLARTTHSPRVAAWATGRTGQPTVLAARIEGSALSSPNAAEFKAASLLDRARDLGDRSLDPALRALGERHGFSAAAPLHASASFHAEPSDDADAILLIGCRDETLGQVRPRTLAALTATAENLQAPAAVALASQRFRVLDEEMRRLDRLASLGGLIAEVVHEIRNPLVPIKTFLQLLPEREADPDFTEGFLEVAREELQRIERLLNLVLEHGRPARGQRTEVKTAPETALDSVLQLVRFRADEGLVQIAVELAPELPKPALDADGLRQVLLNLLLNAIEASPAQSTVTVRGSAIDDRLRLCIDDQGPGVPEEQRLDLLRPFYSTKSERPGGLGLSITARIVEEAGGQLFIEDAPSGGARFRLELPS